MASNHKRELRYHKHLTPEPTFKSNKSHLIETMSKKILKFTKAVYNKSTSPTYIDILEKLKIREESFDFSEKHPRPKLIKKNQFVSGRKLNPEGVNILNLPRLPYGKHLNYDESNFSQNHIIQSLNSTEAENIKNIDKQYRLQKKYNRKNKSIAFPRFTFKSNLKNYLLFSTDASDIRCPINEDIQNSYDDERKKFKFMATYRDLESDTSTKAQSKKLQPIKSKISINDIEKILRPECFPQFSKKSLIFE